MASSLDADLSPVSAANAAEDTASISTGQVKWFDKVKGFGFVSNLDDNTDYFVHHTQIKASVNDDSQRELFRYLIAGEYVEFKLQSVAEGQGQRVMACHVTGIRGGDLMYNIIHQQHQERHAFHRDKYGDEGEEEESAPMSDAGSSGAARAEAGNDMEMEEDDGFTQVRRKQRRKK